MTERAPLRPADPESAERFWRTATYLAAAQLYLRTNCLLERPIAPDDLKRPTLGHWGTSPAMTFVYAHLSDLARRSGNPILLVVGPGHAAPGLLACMYLDRTLAGAHPELDHGRPGLDRFVARFGAVDGGFSTEISAATPGAIYAGGELGPALAVAQGAALDDPDVTVACMLGDGELETGPAACAWQGSRALDGLGGGAVLPIVNLNGFRMGGRSILATLTREEQHAYFAGHGYDPLFAGPSHPELGAALGRAWERLRSSRAAGARSRPPVVVVATPKGWSGPGTHKAPYQRSADDPADRAALEEWLRSYRPEELFDAEGAPSAAALRCLPPAPLRLGERSRAAAPARPLAMPAHDPSAAVGELRGPVQAIGARLADVMRLNGASPSFRVFSPDELSSNRLDAVADAGTPIEVLSEHLCQGWLQGYLETGRHGVFTTYEAFAPVVASMAAQHMKFVAGAREVPWRAPRPSLNYVLTSLGWNNCYTHQNPGFLDVLLTGEFPHVRVYTPADATAAVAALDAALRSTDRVNAIVAGKIELPVWLGAERARDEVADGFATWLDAGDEAGPDVVLAAVGDRLCVEAVHAASLLRSALPGLSVRLVVVHEVTSLGSPELFEAGRSDGSFAEHLGDDTPVLFAFTGYPSTLKRLLFDRPSPGRFRVHGFHGESDPATPFSRLVACEVDRFQLASRLARMALGTRPELADEAAALQRLAATRLTEQRTHVRAVGLDPDWVAPDAPREPAPLAER